MIDEREQAAGDERDLAERGRERERGEARGEVGDERAEGDDLEHDAGGGRGDRDRDRRAREHEADGRRVGAARRAAARPRRGARGRSRSAPGRARRGRRGRPRGRRRAGPRRARRGTRRCRSGRRRPAAGCAPRSDELAGDTSAGSAPDVSADDDLRVEVRAQREQPVGSHPRDPPVVLERAHDAADAEADLAAVGDLRREHRAGPQPERVGHPDADLDLVRPADPAPLGERRVLEVRVVAGVGDQPHRLAEPEGVRRVDAVALADGVDPGQPRRRAAAGPGRARPRAGSACRPSPGPRAAARAATRARASASRRRRRRRSSRPPRTSARARRWRSARRARRGRRRGRRGGGRAPRRAGEAAAAWRRARSPPRRISTGGRRAARQAGQVAAATTTATTASSAQSQRRSERPARAELVQRGEEVGGRAGDDERAEGDAERGGRDGDDRRLDRLLRGDPARAEAERALDAEAGQAALDLGVRAGGEHRPGGDQRDQRERDQQRDHDPRGLGEQDLHARAGDELQLAEPEGDGARLRQRDVGLRRVVEPQQRRVRRARGRDRRTR